MSPMSRRFVLAGAALTGASLLVPIAVRPARAQRNGDYEITDWILIAADGQVTLGLSQPEVGQGSYTALPQILADELDADWARVKVRFVTGRAAYKIAFRQEAPAQKEGASMSTTALYQRLRTAGAAAREVLARPFDDRIFFAGEATHGFDFSSAHGAHDSGVRAAEHAMAALAAVP